MTSWYSTCTTCGELLDVVDRGQATHPTTDCARPDELTDRWLAALEAGEEARADRLVEPLDRPVRAVPLLDAALTYLRWGWSVFPITPGGKTPLTRHGFKDASTDPARVRGWWRDTPTANIGLPTGRRFDVVDVDMPTGTWSWVALRDSGELPAVHGTALTPSGLHLYVPTSEGGNLAGALPGVDYRGAGGYVVAPPSRRALTVEQAATGHQLDRYAWSLRPSPRLTGGEPTAVA